MGVRRVEGPYLFKEGGFAGVVETENENGVFYRLLGVKSTTAVTKLTFFAGRVQV